MLKVKVEVIEAEGTINSGIGKKTGLPWCNAAQRVAVFEEGEKYPKQMKMRIKLPEKDGVQTGSAQWMPIGMYEADVVIGVDPSFEEAVIKIRFDQMRSITKLQKAA